MALNVSFWNAGGFSTNKCIEIATIMKRQDTDVLAITEAGASSNATDRYPIAGYNTYNLPRTYRRVASGMIVYVKKEITVKFRTLHTMTDANKMGAVELLAWRGHRRFELIFVYNPPNNTPPVEILEDVLSSHTILMGDFNAHSTRWGYSRANSAGTAMEGLIDSNLVEQIPTEKPTFLSFKGEQSNPDLIIAHVALAPMMDVRVLESPTGYGHRIIQAIVRQGSAHGKVYEPADLSPRWNFKKADWPKYTNMTNEMITAEILHPTNPDRSCQALYDMLWDCALNCIPRGNRKNYKPFWTDELTRLKSDRDCARRQAELSGCLEDSITLRQKQAVLTRAVIEAKRACFNNFLQTLDHKKDGKKAFTFLNRLVNEASPPLLNEPIHSRGKRIVGNKAKATALMKNYAAVSRLPHQKLVKLALPQGCLSNEDDRLFNAPFTSNELDRALGQMKNGRCAGPDQIPSELLRHFGRKAKGVLLVFFNICWEKGIPSMWRKAEVIPILKKGKPASDPASYRPIALTNACCKLMERLVVNRLNCFLEERHLLTDFQAGFRKSRGSVEQVAFLTQQVKDGFHRQQSTVAVFVDFKSAYDLVWRPLLIQKLQGMGVAGCMLAWIKSFLAQRFARVKYQNSRSSYMQLRNGLPQGAVISCSLFNVLINDLIPHLQATFPGVEGLLYADDLVLYATSSSVPSVCNLLNAALTQLSQWCKSNRMVVNTQKTVCQLFSLSNKQHDLSLVYDGEVLPVQNATTYLGVVMDQRITWRKHAEKLAASGMSRLRLLKRLAGITWGAKQDLLTKTYTAYIRPAVEYGAELLSTASKTTSSIVDKVQNNALRAITGGAKSNPIAAMELQLGIEPLELRREMNTIRMVERLERLPVDHWRNYQSASTRLKTQRTVLTVAGELREKYNLQLPEREPFTVERAMDAQLKTPAVYLSLNGFQGNKDDISPNEWRALAIETTRTRYPTDSWIHAYTDGSWDREARRVGAGYFAEGLFEGSAPLPQHSTNFDAEMLAVNLAAKEVANLGRAAGKCVFLIDSQTTIQLLSSANPPPNELVRCTRLEINSLIENGWELAYQWIPSHCGISGNERADSLAKRGSELPPISGPATFKHVTAVVKQQCKASQRSISKSAAQGKKWMSLLDNPIPPNLPRKDLVANFRLTTGHDYLQAHLHRIGVMPTPLCPLCDLHEPMDDRHLEVCPKILQYRPNDDFPEWKKKSIMYWAARKEMQLLPRPGER